MEPRLSGSEIRQPLPDRRGSMQEGLAHSAEYISGAPVRPPEIHNQRMASDFPQPAVSATESTPSAATVVEESCPPPLEWQDVLREFHRQADSWYLDRQSHRITGRTIGSGPPLYLL